MTITIAAENIENIYDTDIAPSNANIVYVCINLRDLDYVIQEMSAKQLAEEILSAEEETESDPYAVQFIFKKLHNQLVDGSTRKIVWIVTYLNETLHSNMIADCDRDTFIKCVTEMIEDAFKEI